MKVILYLATVPAILLAAPIIKAQSPTPGDFGNSAPGTVFDSNGSRQFFQQGRDKLYFLPAEKSSPILKIDDEIAEEVEENTQDAVDNDNEQEQTE